MLAGRHLFLLFHCHHFYPSNWVGRSLLCQCVDEPQLMVRPTHGLTSHQFSFTCLLDHPSFQLPFEGVAYQESHLLHVATQNKSNPESDSDRLHPLSNDRCPLRPLLHRLELQLRVAAVNLAIDIVHDFLHLKGREAGTRTLSGTKVRPAPSDEYRFFSPSQVRTRLFDARRLPIKLDQNNFSSIFFVATASFVSCDVIISGLGFTLLAIAKPSQL